jgi:lysophospholipase L1-like esterase
MTKGVGAYFEEIVIPMIADEFPDLVSEISIRVGGSFGLGIADEHSDLDADLYLDDELWRARGGQLQLALLHDVPRFAATTDHPEICVAAASGLLDGQCGAFLEGPGDLPWERVSIESLYSVQENLVLRDAHGLLRRLRDATSPERFPDWLWGKLAVPKLGALQDDLSNLRQATERGKAIAAYISLGRVLESMLPLGFIIEKRKRDTARTMPGCGVSGTGSRTDGGDTDMRSEQPDPLQGHSREWPSTPYSDEARAEEPRWETSCCIGLFGDCTVDVGVPPAMRPESHLAVRLRRAFAGQAFVIRNLGDSGGTAGTFDERRLDDVPRLDVAFVRYGVNDRKRDGIAGCIANLKTLCKCIERRHPRVSTIIETGIWVDYPRHYLYDRNPRLAPLYEAMRELAAAEGYPLLDIFRNMEIETERGNWDLRIRGLPDREHAILDDSFDQFFGDDPAFFTNIHPNSRCLGLIADWEVALLKRSFGARLPT